MLKKSTILAVLSILLIGLVIRLEYFVGPCCDDDVSYLDVAHNIMSLNFIDFRSSYVFAYRTMMVAPIALSFRIFGVSDVTASLFVLLTSVGSIAVAFAIGRMLFNENTGIIAALLMSFYPLEAEYSTHLVPDVPLAFFMGAGVLLFLYAEKKGGNLLYTCAGIAMGLAYLVKIMGLLLLLFVVSYFILFSRKKMARGLLLFLAGFAVVFLIEALYSCYFTGNVFTNYESYISAQKMWGHMKERSNDEVREMLLFYPRATLGIGIDGYMKFFSCFFWLLALSIITPAICREKRKEFLVILLWFFSIALYLQFGTIDISRLVLMPRDGLPRLLMVLSIPMTLAIARFLDAITSNKTRLIGIIILGLFITPLFIDSISKIREVTTYDNEQTLRDTRELSKVMKELPKKDIYYYWYTRDIGLLRFYLNFDEENRMKTYYYSSCESIRNAYVIADESRWYFEGWLSYPDCLRNPPPTWKIVRVINASNDGIYATFDPKVYSVE